MLSKSANYSETVCEARIKIADCGEQRSIWRNFSAVEKIVHSLPFDNALNVPGRQTFGLADQFLGDIFPSQALTNL